ncbi:P1 family peptidase [Bifidobacterium parmae]|uniref:D-aminopeptidase n=1 Tax=Bifidobacterium parmae TaxID=361854 RepID=A0A2N5J4J6_9BIFI|nr:P1 family peptidase [Bifidobacterium parmae]PLS29123.1 D-aminopeptidase [Bifidobacterium parmae]
MGTNAIWNHDLYDGPAGKRNLITDVPGVRVGHVTLRSPDGAAPAIRTGVTAIVPPGDCFASKLPAAAYVSNGFGKSMGLVQVGELGSLETPILMTNTLSCGACFDALVDHALAAHPAIGVDTGTVNPVVMECNDGPINSIRARAVTPAHGLEAIAAAGEDFDEGDVGAGTGMTCFGLKGGVGSASRVVRVDGRDHVIGVLTLTNFGSRECLRLDGEPVGLHLAEAERIASASISAADGDGDGDGTAAGNAGGEDKGSIVAVIATDLPVDSRQLRRMAKRVTVGIARCGGYIGNGSGEIVVAFSTANRIDHWAGDDLTKPSDHPTPAGGPLVETVTRLNENAMDRCFRAVAAASEEAIVSSLLHAHGVRGRDGKVTPSLRDALRDAGLALPESLAEA